MPQDGPGLGHSGQPDRAPAVAEESERLLRDNPEPLPAIGRISVGLGCCLLIATSLSERRVRRDEGVFGVWVRLLKTGHEAFGEFGVTGFKGRAHHHREGYEVTRVRARTREGVKLGKERDRCRRLTECQTHRGRAREGADVFHRTRDPAIDLEPLKPGNRFVGSPAHGQDLGLASSDPGEVDHVTARLERWSHLGDEDQRLVELAGGGKQAERVGPERLVHLGEPPRGSPRGSTLVPRCR
jgi:hypothetical protein